MFVYPSYYQKFACIAGRCRHSCCIGWEIDVDEDTYGAYQSVTGEIGERLRASLCDEDTVHFILGEGERCPFLNRDNLCDLILSLGEDSLCEICREHPRFYNVLSSDTEVGLGLCCEEAARLILSEKEPMTLIGEHESKDAFEAACLLWRDEVFGILQDRGVSMEKRSELLLEKSEKTLPNVAESIALLLSLEIMTPEWRDLLSRALSMDGCKALQGRDREMEQFSVYLAYRYLITAFDLEDLLIKTAFVAWSFSLVSALGGVLSAERGALTREALVELCRLFSCEIEYDEDNLQAILDYL